MREREALTFEVEVTRVEGVGGQERLQESASAAEVAAVIGFVHRFQCVVISEAGVGRVRGGAQRGDGALRLLVVPVEVNRGANDADEFRIVSIDGFDDALRGGDVVLIFIGLCKLILELNLLDGIIGE